MTPEIVIHVPGWFSLIGLAATIGSVIASFLVVVVAVLTLNDRRTK